LKTQLKSPLNLKQPLFDKVEILKEGRHACPLNWLNFATESIGVACVQTLKLLRLLNSLTKGKREHHDCTLIFGTA